MVDLASKIYEVAAKALENEDIQVRGLNSDVVGRLRETVDGFGSAAKLAKAIGVSPSSLSGNLSGAREPRVSLVAAISRATGVSMDWIMFGEGSGSPAQQQTMAMSPMGYGPDDVVSVPFYDVRVSAGPGARPLTEEPARFMEIGRRMLEMLGLKPSDAAMMPVQGDSGLPNMADGDYVLVDRSATELRDGGMYVIGIDDDVVVKRVERLLDRSVLLRSDNPAYRPQTVSHSDAERLRVIGRVKWAIRPF